MTQRYRNRDLLLISILALYLELLLIRWIGTEVNIFAYLQNAILVVCFLGLGTGCLTSRQPSHPREYLVPLTVLVLILSIPWTAAALRKVSLLLTTLGDVNALETMAFEAADSVSWAIPIGLGVTFGLMLLVWQVFVPIGRVLGSLMNDHPNPIEAYSINIFGSLVGIALFVLQGVFHQPPTVWLLIVGALVWYFVRQTVVHRFGTVVLLLLLVAIPWIVTADRDALRVLWSPYQKLALNQADSLSEHPSYHYFVRVNNTSYQGLMDLSIRTVGASPDLYPRDEIGLSQYDIPLLVHPDPRRVLVVGSGTGNDVAGALRHGAEQITAVEIDPAIIALGRAFHPEQPYASSKVRVVNDDARSFFASTGEQFDVISFGLLDSHTSTAMTNARLDHYVYTRESIAMARRLLAPGGVMTLTFAAHRPFIGDRMAGVLRSVFGEAPMAFRIPQSILGYGGLMFLSGDSGAIHGQVARNGPLAALITRWSEESPVEFSYTTETTSDDWPYLYLDSRRIPVLYFILGLMLGCLFLYTRWRAKAPEVPHRWTPEHWHFFFLGAAFLLLEVHNISKAAVVLGNTWQVNAVIISGILVMILLANLVHARWPNLHVNTIYAGLIASCLVLFVLDFAQFAWLPLLLRITVVGGLAAMPILFSGIVFIRSFAASTMKDQAFGANLMGSLAGGLLQTLSFLIGVRALLLLVALLYLAAALLHAMRLRRRDTVEAALAVRGS